jgi:anti-anti-sigma factor
MRMENRDEQTPGSALSMDSERSAAAHRIRLVGELDLAAADRVDRELRRVEATDADKIVVELDGLQFLDSSGARVLVDAGGRSAASGSRLRLSESPFPQVRRLLELTRLRELLPFDG